MLRPVQDVFDGSSFPDLIVGLGHPDDAAVWRLEEDRALVITTDFFTPIVDDPYDYGAIAAANSLSDVYAMGARPFLALNVAAMPTDLPVEIVQTILRGGAEKALEAGVVIAGGHTVQDKEPKFGLIAVGFVHPDRMITKAGAQVGDLLILTKPLGFGVITTALKQDEAQATDVAEAVEWMKQLNRTASELAVAADVSGGTDITGFGLLGHARELAAASGVGLRLRVEQIPVLGSARRYADQGFFPSGSEDNRRHFSSAVRFASGISEPDQMLLFDAQTSGGLLLAVPPKRQATFQERARKLNQPFWVIGEVIPGTGIEVV